MTTPGGGTGPPRPRNRRQASSTPNASASTSTSLLDISEPPSERTSRAPSPYSSIGSRAGRGSTFQAPAWNGRDTPVNTAINRASGILDAGWFNFTGLASSLLGDQTLGADPSGSNNTSQFKRAPPKTKPLPWGLGGIGSGSTGKSSQPTERPTTKDIATGALAQRERNLRAMKTASVLESHEGVNGGLDVAGRFKRRTSDEDLWGLNSDASPIAGAAGTDSQAITPIPADEGCLVYVHHVSLSETYAGIVLKYRCRDDVIKKANGIWNTSHVHVRKHLFVPVDACEVKGRPCEAPGYGNGERVDLLAATPLAGDRDSVEESTLEGANEARGAHGEVDYFGGRVNGGSSGEGLTELKGEEEEGKAWTHVKWVKIDGFASPVEIGRIPRRTLGYYPPRRKKSVVSAASVSACSGLSTPRQSMDFVGKRGSFEVGSPGSVGTSAAARRRGDSLMSNRQCFSGAPRGYGSGGRGRLGSTSTVDDGRPAWMRGPGGVGTMGRNVTAPGPSGDALNKWAKKHFPGLAVDEMASMSVTGSEAARLGFGGGEGPEIAQGGQDGGVEQEGPGRGNGSVGFDKAAIAIESWIRGAWQSGRGVVREGVQGSPRGGTTGLGVGVGVGGREGGIRAREGDLIELEDASDDGRIAAGTLLGQDAPGIGPHHVEGSGGGSGWSVAPVGGSVRGRNRQGSLGKGKGKKSD